MDTDGYKTKICELIKSIEKESLLRKIYITIKIWAGD